MGYYISDFEKSGENAVALEDNILLKGKPATAGSKMLENFIAPYSATVVEKLLEKGYTIAGKTKMDEFGIGKMWEKTPEETLPAVKVVADGLAEFSLCSDIFGERARQAAENGCCYIRPSYGTVSRFGLVPLATSMDQIGIVCKNLGSGFKLLCHMAGKDPKDGAMLPEKEYCYGKSQEEIKIGLPAGIIKKADEPTRAAIKDFAQKFEHKEMELEYFDVYKQVMCVLSSAEISANTNRYDGIKFGYRASAYKSMQELYTKTRTEGFGSGVKFAAIVGTMVLSQEQYGKYYEKAMKLRRLIKEAVKFDEYKLILLPLKIGDDAYENLALYALAPLLGLPCISFMHRGQALLLLANTNGENLLLSAGEACTA